MITDLEARHEPLFAKCLEDRLPEAEEAGAIRARWIALMKERGLRVKIAVDERAAPVGMIQYVPAGVTLLDGDSRAYFAYCIWVTRYDDDRGNHQRRGLGTELLTAAEIDARALGASGMAAWGLILPFWMKASWFKTHGYRRVDRLGIAALMWKPFIEGIETPRFVRRRKTPEAIAGQVTVTSFLHGHCRAANVAHERARRACAEIGGPVVHRVIDTTNMTTAREWGLLDALYVDDQEVSTGPPPSYDKIKRLINRRARGLRCE
jgi:GNAT superfamily N-acetyltransferase